MLNTRNVANIEYTVLRTLGLLLPCLFGASAVLAQPAAAPAVERTVLLETISGVAAPIALHVSLQPEHAAQMDRVVEAAQEALTLYSEWISPYAGRELTIVDQPWNSSDGGSAEAGRVTLHTRWLVPAEVLEPEADVVHGIGSQWWGGAIKVRGAEGFDLAEGLNRYLQGRVLERIFDRRYQVPASSAFDEHYFGRFIPWRFRGIRLAREATERDTRIALAFHTLERYLGWPALQQALSVTARRFNGSVMTRADFFGSVNDATGRDLTWFFDPAFNPARVFDYSVGALSSVPASGPECGGKTCYETTVEVRRNGDALFTGTGRVPVGEYASGRALPILVTFSDGQRLTDRWDGRAPSKTFAYYSATPALSAAVDPERVLLLDANDTNNSYTLQPAAGLAASKWALTWMVWLQDLLLTYAFLV